MVEQETSDTRRLAAQQAQGMACTELAPSERARMREGLRPVYDKYTRTLGEDVLRQTLAALQRARGAAK